MRGQLWMCGLAALLIAMGSTALAQRGTGDDQGVVRSGVAVETATVEGTVVEVMEIECADTTGRSPVGVHLIVALTDGRTVNLHLGPLAAMEDVLTSVDAGDDVNAPAFRTDAMRADDYVATSVTVDGRTFVLRDEALRPTWALEAGAGGRAGAGRGDPPRQGRAVGPCWW